MSQPAKRTRRTAAERRAAAATDAQASQEVDDNPPPVEDPQHVEAGVVDLTEEPQDSQEQRPQQQRQPPSKAAARSRRADPTSVREVEMDEHSDGSGADRASPEENGQDEHHHHRHQRSPPPLPSSTFSASNERNHIKIMLATDNHVGYMERDPVRSQDSIRTFEEILQLAVEHQVDLILMGGDLFHENKPSRATLHQVMALLRQYTLGDRPIQVELLSDPNDGALPGYDFPAVNYEDQNLNVSIPVFSIHGNHDDPQGTGETGALSALDLLSVSGLINYFGKIELPSDDAAAAAPSARAAKGGGFQEKGIRIKPVLLQKGETRLALYGMGNIKDERMHFELRANRVRMFRPQEDPDSWFNILCVHQNRVAHNPKACVPETMFDDSVHLVVWGHEHEQLIQPQAVAEKRYHITQPGSSIATSLSPGEAVEKCVAIIHVENTDFLIEPIPLKTVRPFVMDDMMLAEELEEYGYESRREDIMKLLRTRVNGLIQKATKEYAEGHPGSAMPLPLVRLRVEYTNQEISNPQRFGQEFTGKVANPKDVLQFTKKKSGGGTKGKDQANAYVDLDELDLLPSEKLERVDVGMLVQEYLQAQNLDILNPEGLEGAVLNFVEKDDREAIDSFVNKMLRNTVKGLVTIDPEEAQLQNELERLRQEQQRGPRTTAGDEDADERDEGGARNARTQGAKSLRTGKGQRTAAAAAADSDDSMMEELDAEGDAFDDGDARALDEDDGEEEEDAYGGARARASPAKGARGRASTVRSKPSGRSAGTGAATASKTRATPARRATIRQKTFLGASDDDDDDDGFEVVEDQGSDQEMEDETSRGGSSRHAAALGLSTQSSAKGKRTTAAARATKPNAKATTTTAAAASRRTATARSGTSATDGAGLRQSQLSFAGGGRATARSVPARGAIDVDEDDEFEEPPAATSSRARGSASAAGRRAARK